MTWRDVVYDAPFDDFIGHLTGCPMRYWSFALLWLLTRQGFNLTTLISGDPPWCSRTREILEAVFNAHIIQGDRLQSDPSCSPQAHGIRCHGEPFGNLTVRLAVCGGQDHTGAERDLLSGRVPAGKLRQTRLLGFRKLDNRGMGSRHGLIPLIRGLAPSYPKGRLVSTTLSD